MFSSLTASTSHPPWPPMPTPAMLSLPLGDGPPRPRTWGFTIMKVAAAALVVATNLRRERTPVAARPALPVFGYFSRVLEFINFDQRFVLQGTSCLAVAEDEYVRMKTKERSGQAS